MSPIAFFDTGDQGGKGVSDVAPLCIPPLCIPSTLHPRNSGNFNSSHCPHPDDHGRSSSAASSRPCVLRAVAPALHLCASRRRRRCLQAGSFVNFMSDHEQLFTRDLQLCTCPTALHAEIAFARRQSGLRGRECDKTPTTDFREKFSSTSSPWAATRLEVGPPACPTGLIRLPLLMSPQPNWDRMCARSSHRRAPLQRTRSRDSLGSRPRCENWRVWVPECP